MDTILRRTGRDLDNALTSAQQTLDLLRSQLQGGRIDAPFFEKRITDVTGLLADVIEDRKHSGQQERLAKLYEVSRVIGSSLDLQTVLDQVMDAIIQLTRAERGFLMLLDEDNHLAVQVARNFDQENVGSESFTLSRTITSRVLEGGSPVVTTNAQEDPRFSSSQSIVAQALRSIMATPLRARGQIIGVIYVDNRLRSGLFSDADLDMLDAFAGQAAVAIDNARLFRETDKALAARVEELTMLGWIDRQLNETLDLQNTMRQTLEWSIRVCSAENGTLAIYDPEGDSWRVAAAMGKTAPLHEGDPVDGMLPFFDFIQSAITSQDAQFKPLGVNGVASALFCVPIRRENNVVALALFGSLSADAFTEESRRLVKRVAERAAIALENGRLYEAVRAANLAKSEFVSIVAHELKNPMTSIGGYTDLLKVAGPVTERQEQFIATIKNVVNRMRLLVQDLSDISRIESGHLRIEIKPVSVQEVVDAALEATVPEIEQRGHHLMLHIDPVLGLVSADRDRLIQVLVNLLSNAYKYTPEGGTIRVEAAKRDEHAAFSVQDNGVGMSPEQIAKLGTKFWRADNGLGQPGTGLGFAITRNLIDVMGGTLDIQSEPGRGSTFTFELPLV